MNYRIKWETYDGENRETYSFVSTRCSEETLEQIMDALEEAHWVDSCQVVPEAEEPR